jgi:hypothetical protein
VPVSLLQRKRTRDQQEAARIVRLGIERAKTEVQPLLNEAVLKLRRAFERDLQAGMDQRERELASAISEQRRLLAADADERRDARADAEARLTELNLARRHADELERMVIAAAPGSDG